MKRRWAYLFAAYLANGFIGTFLWLISVGGFTHGLPILLVFPLRCVVASTAWPFVLLGMTFHPLSWDLTYKAWLSYLPGALLLYWLVRRFARRSSAAGLCPTCGYDLRATPERCPACGTVISTASTKSTETT